MDGKPLFSALFYGSTIPMQDLGETVGTACAPSTTGDAECPAHDTGMSAAAGARCDVHTPCARAGHHRSAGGD